jgi:hypothetical protein
MSLGYLVCFILGILFGMTAISLCVVCKDADEHIIRFEFEGADEIEADDIDEDELDDEEIKYEEEDFDED